ncbi:hypothetical protein HG536_0C03360 [Torulaspora globosa]|uniref:Glycoside hydrolase family 5 domain-containing protein n=1 Tax=Torulaspora globosa TaxID=48254 RepID=A0A7G3ZF81_9SACH|nr:uncharacterized protein HG536_0C03360 [Torulaspora globosa]QLL32167.1 hypothetical protein HG536_0C03360 [Torulaspora globosa]
MFDKIKQKIEKAKGALEHSDERVLASIPETSGLSKKDIYRNRYNHGVNLGGCFILEKWIYESVFDKGGDNEFDAVSSQVNHSSVDEAASKLTKHYNDYISKIDWNWLKNEAGITSFRIPIGYWHVGNGQLLDELPFEPLREVYSRAKPWDILKNLINKAAEYDIGVLIDVHGLPGGANTDMHSGCKNSSPSFFNKSKHIDKMVNVVLPFICRDACVNCENVIGLQVVNEAVFDNSAHGQKSYYSRAVAALNRIDPGLPVVISDGWWPDQWADWLGQTNLAAKVVVDSHVYRCFSAEDKGKDANQIINHLSESISWPRDRIDFVVGEFSCVLDEETWRKTAGNRDEWVRKFGKVQTSNFANVASWGWFFWTLQFQYGDGGEWGLVPMVKKGAIPRRPQGSPTVDENRVKEIINEHIAYWKDKGGDAMEHWRFEDGLRGAIADINAFAQFDNSRIGRWKALAMQRRAQYISRKGDSKYMWEWDQGFQRAIDEFGRY